MPLQPKLIKMLGNVVVMRRKQARNQIKNVNSLHVTDPEVRRCHHADDQDHAATPHRVLIEKAETTAAEVQNAARKEVTRVGVTEMIPKNLSATATKDEMVMMVIVTGRANRQLQKDQEMQTMTKNQMLMAMNQNWTEMRTTRLKVMEVAQRMKIRTKLSTRVT